MINPNAVNKKIEIIERLSFIRGLVVSGLMMDFAKIQDYVTLLDKQLSEIQSKILKEL